jgi:hypothetical protein
MRAVSTKAKPDGATATLLAVVAGFLALAGLPDDLGSLRLAGISLLWWYGGLVGPVVAVAAALSRRRASPELFDQGNGPARAR